jgi:hypothetical protein
VPSPNPAVRLRMIRGDFPAITSNSRETAGIKTRVPSYSTVRRSIMEDSFTKSTRSYVQSGKIVLGDPENK